MLNDVKLLICSPEGTALVVSGYPGPAGATGDATKRPTARGGCIRSDISGSNCGSEVLRSVWSTGSLSFWWKSSLGNLSICWVWCQEWAGARLWNPGFKIKNGKQFETQAHQFFFTCRPLEHNQKQMGYHSTVVICCRLHAAVHSMTQTQTIVFQKATQQNEQSTSQSHRVLH